MTHTCTTWGRFNELGTLVSFFLPLKAKKKLRVAWWMIIAGSLSGSRSGSVLMNLFCPGSSHNGELMMLSHSKLCNTCQCTAPMTRALGLRHTAERWCRCTWMLQRCSGVYSIHCSSKCTWRWKVGDDIDPGWQWRVLKAQHLLISLFISFPPETWPIETCRIHFPKWGLSSRLLSWAISLWLHNSVTLHCWCCCGGQNQASGVLPYVNMIGRCARLGVMGSKSAPSACPQKKPTPRVKDVAELIPTF